MWEAMLGKSLVYCFMCTTECAKRLQRMCVRYSKTKLWYTVPKSSSNRWVQMTNCQNSVVITCHACFEKNGLKVSPLKLQILAKVTMHIMNLSDNFDFVINSCQLTP